MSWVKEPQKYPKAELQIIFYGSWVGRIGFTFNF